MLWQCLTDSLTFFKNNLFALCAIILPIVIPVEVFSAVFEHFFITEESSLWVYSLPILLMLFAYPLYGVGVVFYMAATIDGNPITTKTAWAWGLKFWAPYLLLSILVSFAVVMGLMVFIIPGIVLAVRYAYAEFELLFNNKTPIQAIKLSWASTRESFWVLFGGYVVLATFLIAPLFIIGPMLDGEGLMYEVIDTVINIVSSVLEMLFTIYAYRVYRSGQQTQTTEGS